MVPGKRSKSALGEQMGVDVMKLDGHVRYTIDDSRLSDASSFDTAHAVTSSATGPFFFSPHFFSPHFPT